MYFETLHLHIRVLRKLLQVRVCMYCRNTIIMISNELSVFACSQCIGRFVSLYLLTSGSTMCLLLLYQEAKPRVEKITVAIKLLTHILLFFFWFSWFIHHIISIFFLFFCILLVSFFYQRTREITIHIYLHSTYIHMRVCFCWHI